MSTHENGCEEVPVRSVAGSQIRVDGPRGHRLAASAGVNFAGIRARTAGTRLVQLRARHKQRRIRPSTCQLVPALIDEGLLDLCHFWWKNKHIGIQLKQ
jgi:hypothetical protein